MTAFYFVVMGGRQVMMSQYVGFSCLVLRSGGIDDESVPSQELPAKLVRGWLIVSVVGNPCCWGSVSVTSSSQARSGRRAWATPREKKRCSRVERIDQEGTKFEPVSCEVVVAPLQRQLPHVYKTVAAMRSISLVRLAPRAVESCEPSVVFQSIEGPPRLWLPHNAVL